MGRYYQTATGREGKFWFAVQPSDDPQKIYGMDEVEYDDEDYDTGNTVDYYTDDKDYVRNKLEEQYNQLILLLPILMSQQISFYMKHTHLHVY